MNSTQILLSLCAVLCTPFACVTAAETNILPRFGTTATTPLPARVAQSAVIAYAKADTNKAPNIQLAVAEVWKGAHEAQALGVTTGMQFPFRWPDEASGPMMDAAVLFFQGGSDRSAALRTSAIYVVRAGRRRTPAAAHR